MVVTAPRLAFWGLILGVTMFGFCKAYAQVAASVGLVVIENLTPQSVRVGLPSLPEGYTSYKLQRATHPVGANSPPLPGCVAWLKAGDLSELGDGAAIAQWNGVIGSGQNATQPSPSWRPQLVANAVAGRPAVHFDGIDDNLSLPPGMSDFSGGLSAFVVTRPQSNAYYSRFFDFGVGASHAITLCREGTSSSLFYGTQNNSNWGGNSYPNAIVNDTFQVFGVVQQGGTPGTGSAVRAYKNGNEIGAGQTYVPATVERTGNLIGKSNDGGAALFQGDIAEILIYNVALSEANRDDVQAYLQRKYGIALATNNLGWTDVATGLTGNSSYLDATVNPGTTYWYRCVAQGGGLDVTGPERAVTTQPIPPVPPGRALPPVFESITATQVNVIAPALPERAVLLRLEKKLSGEPDTAFSGVTAGMTPGTSILVRNLSPQTGYAFRFVAVNEGGETPGASAAVTTQPVLIADGSFEVPNLGPGVYGYTTLTGSPWTFDDHSGIASNNSDFHNGVAPEGVQVGFLNQTGTIKQNVSLSAGTYALDFSVAAFRGFTDDMVVKIDGQVVGGFTQANAPNDWQRVITDPFTVTAGTHEVCLAGLDTFGGDRTLFIDDVHIAPAVVTPPPTPRGGSFEVPSIGAGSVIYKTLTGSPWTFDDHSGVSGNYGFGYNVAPEGVQVGFLNQTGVMKQNVTLSAGTYSLNFSVATRWGALDDMLVKIDGVIVGGFTQSNAPNDWQRVSTEPFVVIFP